MRAILPSRVSRWCAFVVLSGAAMACVSVIVITATRHQPQITLDQVVFLYLIPTTILVAIVMAWVRGPAFAINVALSILSVAATLVVCELAIGIWERPERQLARYSRAANRGGGEGFDARSGWDVVREQRARGSRAYPVMREERLRMIRVGPGEVFPLSPAPSRVSTVFCNEGGVYVNVDRDEHGFNNPVGLWASAPVDVVLVGDSFTEGYCVNADQSVAGRLRSRWRTVVNLGVSGVGPLHELAVLREFGPALRPRVVLWNYYEGNDLTDVVAEHANPVLRRYLEIGFSQHLMRQQAALDTERVRFLDSALAAARTSPEPTGGVPWNSLLRDAAKLRSLRVTLGFGLPLPPDDRGVQLFARVLDRAAAMVERWGGHLVLVYLPAYRRFASWIGEGAAGRNVVLAIADSVGVPVIDVSTNFRSFPSPRSLWVHRYGHYNAEGYAAVAAAILEGVPKAFSNGPSGRR